MAKDVIVVGGGLSGLVSAYYLTKKGHRVTIVEKSDRLGGLILSENTEYGIVESAANGFLNSDLVDDLFKELGVEMVPALRESRSRYFYRNLLQKFPLSWGESQKLLSHFLPRALFWRRGLRPEPEETLQTWGEKHLGREATRFLMAPALQGIYAGSIDQLSARLIYNRFFGKRRRKPKHSIKNKGLVTPRNGMYQLIEALAFHLKEKNVRFKMNESFDYDIHAKNGEDVVICTRADHAAQILKSRFPQVSASLSTVEMVPLLSVTMFYPNDPKLPKGFGCLIPRGEGFQALGVLFNGHIFPNRVSRPEVRSETWIFGGALAKQVCQWPDAYILSRVQVERIMLFGTRVEPLASRIFRWEKALPHYNTQLEKILNDLEPWPKGLYIVGNYLGDIGLSQMVEQAYIVADGI